MQEPTSDLTSAVDPEEETEKQLVRYMGLAVVFILAAGVIALALLPLFKRMRASTAGSAAQDSAAV